MAKTKVHADEAAAYEVAVQSIMGTEQTLIQRLGIPKRIVMRATAEGLGVMATSPDGSDRLKLLFGIMRAARDKTQQAYREHPELADDEAESQTTASGAEGEAQADGDVSFDILTAAIKEMGDMGMTRNDVLPSLVDFTASVAIALAARMLLRPASLGSENESRIITRGYSPCESPKATFSAVHIDKICYQEETRFRLRNP